MFEAHDIYYDIEYNWVFFVWSQEHSLLSSLLTRPIWRVPVKRSLKVIQLLPFSSGTVYHLTWQRFLSIFQSLIGYQKAKSVHSVASLEYIRKYSVFTLSRTNSRQLIPKMAKHKENQRNHQTKIKNKKRKVESTTSEITENLIFP